MLAVLRGAVLKVVQRVAVSALLAVAPRPRHAAVALMMTENGSVTTIVVETGIAENGVIETAPAAPMIVIVT